jgi:hypothetical protein
LQSDGTTWLEDNTHAYFTLINDGDPATAAVQVDTTTPFASDTVKLVAFTTGDASGEITFILSVYCDETIVTSPYNNTNPY